MKVFKVNKKLKEDVDKKKEFFEIEETETNVNVYPMKIETIEKTIAFHQNIINELLDKKAKIEAYGL